MLRVIAVMAGLTTALPAIAGEMTASEARHFVVGKLFSYTCFDGTRGMARVHEDGSVDGLIQARGTGLTHYGTMPVGTLRTDGERVCASLPRSIMQPCFHLERTNNTSFRGSILGLSFAYCDFTLQQDAHAELPVQNGQLSLSADEQRRERHR
ncbi:MAG TPA: hypothetical protein VJR71_04590 [Pseudolabrys sp.]|nr:hypothetical protein [Pseudolabrys sp.]